MGAPYYYTGMDRVSAAARCVTDRLYGTIGVSDDDLRLFSTAQMSRLRHVSLSAVPTWTVPVGVCASKFEHSLGVGYLARVVTGQAQFAPIAPDLFLAAIAHDIATPPFSHVSEYFMELVVGKNHEAYAADILDGSEFVAEARRQGGTIDRIIGFITGSARPFGDLINGTIDLDNLDNTLRYGISTGLIRTAPYDPVAIAASFCTGDHTSPLYLREPPGIAAWEATRRTVYDYVHSPRNLGTGIMLFRALEFAYREGELTREFFSMRDEEAFSYLSSRCNGRTRTLVGLADRWIGYEPVYHVAVGFPPAPLVAYVSNPGMRGELADAVAHHTGIAPEDVGVYAAMDRAFKSIHLPIVTGGVRAGHDPRSVPAAMIDVYVHPRHMALAAGISAFVADTLQRYGVSGYPVR